MCLLLHRDLQSVFYPAGDGFSVFGGGEIHGVEATEFVGVGYGCQFLQFASGVSGFLFRLDEEHIPFYRFQQAFALAVQNQIVQFLGGKLGGVPESVADIPFQSLGMFREVVFIDTFE